MKNSSFYIKKTVWKCNKTDGSRIKFSRIVRSHFTSHSIDGLISSKLVDNSSCKFHSGSKIRSSDSSELFRFSLVTRSQPPFFSAPYSSINSVLVIPSDPTSYRRDYRLLNPLDPPANAFDDSLIAIVDRWQRQATVSWQRNANRLISTARSGRATLMWRDQIDSWLIVTHGYDRAS